jgi:hypothetical protein
MFLRLHETLKDIFGLLVCRNLRSNTCMEQILSLNASTYAYLDRESRAGMVKYLNHSEGGIFKQR